MDITCAISGIRFKVPGIESVGIPAHMGYYHPIFTLPHNTLYKLYYSRHVKGKMSRLDSYLLFLAFLHATEQVDWQAPATCKPSDTHTIKLIQNNLAQLISVSEKTAVIRHPSFKQPSFVVSYDNGKLMQVVNWIAAWEENLVRFNVTRATAMQRRDLAQVEAKLQQKLSAGVPIALLPATVAAWANQAADFPPLKAEQYMRVIRSCFNASKMFNTPLKLIREVQEYCFSNIEPGSIYFNTLCTILREGAARHLDYLGGSSLALGYTLLETPGEGQAATQKAELKTQAELATIQAKAPAEEPVREDYPSKLEFLKARLAYKVAVQMNTAASPNPTTNIPKTPKTPIEYDYTTTGKTTTDKIIHKGKQL